MSIRREGTEDVIDEAGDPGNLMWVVGQLLMIPVAAFVFSVEMFVKRIQEMQRVTNQGMEVVLAGKNKAAGADQEIFSRDYKQRAEPCGERSPVDEGEYSLRSHLEEKRTVDKDLRDDMLKLVRYKVLFVRREYEVAFPEKEDIVSDNMDGAAFTAWKVAEFIQDLAKKETRVPKKWQDKNYPPAEYSDDGKLLGLEEEDKKYLRVYFEVLERYPREKFKYEEQQIRVLEEIRDRIPKTS
jgi:hypothetical protein